ncbi:hypothetical protein GTY65_06925 [Streptomyces sp. SID8379]|uniref:DUF6274 family protein n=1 Tax=unclassified Streptomyces TaxID=2593676 RepID=UPI0003798350|nr:MULTISPECIES: DUF6274 family protein [unclassified Streptomyces]MYW63809.1 hypothetical protein [Streptomyces sp. SID8379]
MAATRHETRALLRAHLAAASGYRHLTRHCPICHRLLRLAMDPAAEPEEYLEEIPEESPEGPLEGRESASEGDGDESPSKA